MLIRQLLCAGALFLSATALRADVFYFSYSGPSVSANGTLTANKVSPGVYSITDITGTRNGAAISDAPVGGGTFYYSDAVSPPLSAGGISFSVKGMLGIDTVLYTNGVYKEIFAGLPSFSNTLTSFSISSTVPEPSVLLLLFTMGLGLWVLARKLPARKTSLR